MKSCVILCDHHSHNASIMSPLLPKDSTMLDISLKEFNFEGQVEKQDESAQTTPVGRQSSSSSADNITLDTVRTGKDPGTQGHDDEVTNIRRRALDSLIRLPTTHTSNWWPRIEIYFQHLEDHFQELLSPRFRCVWELLGMDSPSDPIDVWHWCFAVIYAYESSTEQDPSIEKIYQQIQRTSQQAVGTRETLSTVEEDKSTVLQAIFAVLCWLSATLKPILESNTAHHLQSDSCSDDSDVETTLSSGSTILKGENCCHVYSSDDVRRPTSKMFNSYQHRIENINNHEPEYGNARQTFANNFEDILYEPSLNYHSLSTIGGIKIKWVDTVTAHLVLNRKTRELSIYGCPSFCAAKIFAQHKVRVIERITKKLLPSSVPVHSTRESASIYREILLSYRLLFGQSSKSRKLIQELLDRPRSSSGAYSSLIAGATQEDRVDPFLKEVCTSPLRSGWSFLGLNIGKSSEPRIPGYLFPSSTLDKDNELVESDTYSAQDEFPTFGARLLTLQRYNMRRQPSRFTDLWRDRRNRLQWFTFWAVLWVGGAGIILALLQFVVSVVQMVYAIHPPI